MGIIKSSLLVLLDFVCRRSNNGGKGKRGLRWLVARARRQIERKERDRSARHLAGQQSRLLMGLEDAIGLLWADWQKIFEE